MTNSLFRKTLTAAAVSMTLVLSGCGSDTINNAIDEALNQAGVEDQEKSVQLPVKISGVAVKGVIQQGQVDVIELNEAGVELGVVGSGVTDSTGRYDIELNDDYQGGPLLIQLRASADTTMVCDVHDESCTYGESIPLESGFELESVVPDVDKAEIAAQITPLTHMAVKRARTAGLSRREMRNANSEISQLLGMNVLEIEPADITADKTSASEEALSYAAFVAGAGKLAFANEKGLKKGLDALAESFADGKFDDQDEVRIDQLLNAVDDQARRAGVDEAKKGDALRDQLNGIRSQLNQGKYDPEPLDLGSEVGDVALAKTLIEDVRTWFNSFEKLQHPLDAFGTDVESAAEILDINAVELSQLGFDIAAAVVEAGRELGSVSALVNMPDGLEVETAAGESGRVLIIADFTDDEGTRVLLQPASAAEFDGVDFELEIASTLSPGQIDEYAEVPFEHHVIRGYIENDAAKFRLEEMSLKSRDQVQEIDLMPHRQSNEIRQTAEFASLGGKLVFTAKGKGSFSGEGVLSFVEVVSSEQTGELTYRPALSYASLTGKIAMVDGNGLTASFILQPDDGAAVTLKDILNHNVSKNGLSLTARLDLALQGMTGAAATLHLKHLGTDDEYAKLSLEQQKRELHIKLHSLEKVTGGSITFYNADGAKLTLQAEKDRIGGKPSGELSANGKPVGSIYLDEGEMPIVRYLDGSFESLI